MHSYDKLSNRLSTDDGRTQASWTGRNAAHSYDRLNRLTQSLYAPTGVRPSMLWNLDALGNWMSQVSDTDFNGLDVTDLADTRSTNMANELTQRSRVLNGTPATAPLRYDHAGNVAEEGQFTGTGTSRPRFYRHDAWNRLVEVREEFGSETHDGRPGRLLGAYTYNGLHWRIRKKVDLNSNGSVDRTIDMRYDASWRHGAGGAYGPDQRDGYDQEHRLPAVVGRAIHR